MSSPTRCLRPGLWTGCARPLGRRGLTSSDGSGTQPSAPRPGHPSDVTPPHRNPKVTPLTSGMPPATRETMTYDGDRIKALPEGVSDKVYPGAV